MLYNFQRNKLYRHLLVGGALCLAGMGAFSCSDRYDLDEEKGQPKGLDNIYGYMERQGNYTNYLRLIDDLDMAEILSKTGSKTLFIADDDAFADFYKSNGWGVHKYEDLSLAQKNLLLKTSMVNTPLTTTMISSAEAPGTGKPAKGEVCRRATSVEAYDSVMVVPTAQSDGIFPDNPRFNELRANRDTVVLFNDGSVTPPMIHFTGAFISSNQLELTDVDFLYNQPEGTFNSDDIYVNNSRVVESNIFCKNGFVHKVDKLVLPLDNMAEIIRKEPKMSVFSDIIERFAVPVDSILLRDSYNGYRQSLGLPTVDTVFVKRYFSDRSFGSTMGTSVPRLVDKNGSTFDGSLKYDPGWNGYIPEIANDRNPMMEDMGVMFVPSNEAFARWWEGSVIQKYYGTVENTPSSVLDDLIRVNQIPAFTTTVPSRFKSVLNDANEPIGITKEDVDSVYIGCNGLVYLTNRVFAPATYSSVLFPAVIDKDRFTVMDKAITEYNYNYYLNSMVSRFIFVLPTNQGLATYIDPVSYGQSGDKKMWEFRLNEKLALEAVIYNCTDNGDGTFTRKEGNSVKFTDGGLLKNRLEDLLDNCIVIEPFREGKKYYRTKGRNFIKIEKTGQGQYDVSGSYQGALGQPLQSVDAWDGEDIRNGRTIAMDGIPMGTPNSVAKTLHDAEVDGENIFSEFFGIVEACALGKQNTKDGWQAGDQVYGNLFNHKEKGAIGAEDTESAKGKVTYLLNNYHYTVYAPTNEAMEEAYRAGLPTLDDLTNAEFEDEENPLDDPKKTRADSIREIMLDFVKYHIQDNAIFVDVDTAGTYETGKTELIKSVEVDEQTGEESWGGKYAPGKPYKLQVKVSGGHMTVTDCRYGYDPQTHANKGGVTANVIIKDGAYNLMAREYWFTSATPITDPTRVRLNNSSAVVIHGIDRPLIYSDGTAYDVNGNPVDTQFEYKYKPLATGK